MQNMRKAKTSPRDLDDGVPLVMGGQGRSADDVRESADAIRGLLVATLGGALIWLAIVWLAGRIL